MSARIDRYDSKFPFPVSADAALAIDPHVADLARVEVMPPVNPPVDDDSHSYTRTDKNNSKGAGAATVAVEPFSQGGRIDVIIHHNGY